MITLDLLNETFQDLVDKYELTLDIKSKMRFNIYSIDDLPAEIKVDINTRMKSICEMIGRKRFDIDHPIMIRKGDKDIIKGGIWSIRIY